MKENTIGIIGDFHIGANGSSYSYFLYQQQIFRNIVQDLVKKNITDLYMVGDFFDNKRYIDILIWDKLQILLEEITQEIKIHIILGNHDLYYSNSKEVTSLKTLQEIPNIQIYDKTTLLNIENKKIQLVPWLNSPEEIEQYIKVLKQDKPHIVLGHFDIQNFYLNNNIEVKHGLIQDTFSEVFRVISGHIHIKQEQKNIIYIGPPWDINWNDSNTVKGYYVLNLNDFNLEFFPHEQKYFQYFNVNEQNWKQIIEDINNNSNRQFKFKLQEELPEFVQYLNEQFEYPEKISAIIEPSINEEEQQVELQQQSSIKDLLNDYVLQQENIPKQDQSGLIKLYEKVYSMEL